MERVIAAVGLGANVGDAPATLAAAVNALAALPDAHLEGVSRLYRTRPVGVVDQAAFHNAAVLLDVPAGPDPATGAMALLLALKGLERSFGRQQRERWGPRELDLDLLLFGPHRVVVERDAGARSEDPARSGVQWLEVPHPSMTERLFVLAPLADLAPALVPPGWSEPIAAARDRRRAVEGTDAAGPVGTWDPTGRAWR
jgi:2-amino-4-hydroxy-6-hydroxymethyldihydropteridine diphosphokinase